jgi:hypothetical protein
MTLRICPGYFTLVQPSGSEFASPRTNASPLGSVDAMLSQMSRPFILMMASALPQLE